MSDKKPNPQQEKQLVKEVKINEDGTAHVTVNTSDGGLALFRVRTESSVRKFFSHP